MNRRIVLPIAAAAVAATTLAAARFSQPGDPLVARGRCVSVTAYPHPTQAGTLLFVRVWEDGTVELYSRGQKPLERDEWVALP